MTAQDSSLSETRAFEKHARRVEPGAMLSSKYRILGQIGEGGMGTIYEAEDVKLRRTVAVKFLPADLVRHPEARER